QQGRDGSRSHGAPVRPARRRGDPPGRAKRIRGAGASRTRMDVPEVHERSRAGSPGDRRATIRCRGLVGSADRSALEIPSGDQIGRGIPAWRHLAGASGHAAVVRAAAAVRSAAGACRGECAVCAEERREGALPAALGALAPLLLALLLALLSEPLLLLAGAAPGVLLRLRCLVLGQGLA